MRKIDILLVAFVALLTAIMAGAMFRGYYQHPELLWRGDPSDRSAHFNLGLSFALAARNHDLSWFLHELEFAKLWPPVHGLMLFPVLLAGGLDLRLGVVPSLVGWTVTVVMTWVITRRFFEDPLSNMLAAGVAIIFAVASPSFRLLATDVMLECLGSALTALAIYFHMRTYTRSHQELNWRLLAITLTFLFFEKYNFWGLTVIALGLTHLLQHRNESIALAHQWWQDRMRIATAIVGDPAVLVFVALAGFIGYIYWRGLQTIGAFGWQISVFPPENLTTIAYAIAFGRLAVAWFRHRRQFDEALGVAGRAIFYWNLVPVAVSFLVPRRLSWFLWVVGPTNTFSAEHDPWSGLLEYARGLAEGFTVAPWAAVLAVLLTLIAVIQRKKFPPQCQATFVLVVTCAMLLILHPNHQARFLASWAFAIWICTGVGAALLFQWATQHVRRRSIRAVLAGSAVATLALATGVTKPSWTVAAAYAHQTVGPSEFDLLPAYLPYLLGSSRIGLLPESSGNFGFLIINAALQCRCRIMADSPGDLRYLSHDKTLRRMSAFADDTRSDVVVGVFAPGNAVPNEWLMEAMKAQNQFDLVATRAVPSHHADVMIWRRKAVPRQSTN